MTTRRSFSETLIHVFGAIITTVMAGLSGVYLMSPPKKHNGGGWVEAADSAKLKIGAAEEVVFERTRVDGWRVSKEKASAWVVKKSEAEVIAFSSACTHLGCAYRYDDAAKNFICPCHTSAFSIDGQVLSGPAPRALDRYEVKLDKGRVMLGDIREA